MQTLPIVKVISGGQTGADQAGLAAARAYGISTGGYIPCGFKTLEGPNPELGRLYGLVEFPSTLWGNDYPARTRANVIHSDGTMRFAFDFGSAGERCTFRALREERKPWFDVNLPLPPKVTQKRVEEAADWIEGNSIQILNIAGNSEQTAPGTFIQTFAFLGLLFEFLGYEMDRKRLTAKVRRR